MHFFPSLLPIPWFATPCQQKVVFPSQPDIVTATMSTMRR